MVPYSGWEGFVVQRGQQPRETGTHCVPSFFWPWGIVLLNRYVLFLCATSRSPHYPFLKSAMKSMLVIDGSASVARVFAEIFEKRGWNASTCGDHDSALERLAGHTTYDVILLSYRVLDDPAFGLSI